MTHKPAFERRPPLSAEARAERQAQRQADAADAMAEHEEREAAKYANMERLRAERLARSSNSEQ